MNRQHFTRTSTGLVIGSAYQAPPPAPGSHAEKIQAALLAPPRAREVPTLLTPFAHALSHLARIGGATLRGINRKPPSWWRIRKILRVHLFGGVGGRRG